MESNVDHQPKHEWWVEDGHEVIMLHVTEYKRDEMHITLCNGTLVVTGDSKSASSETEKIKFTMTFRISKNCCPQDIKARLAGGYLRILLPPNSREDQHGYHKGYAYDDSWLARTLSGLSFDKGLVAKAVAVVIVFTGLGIGGYFAFRHI